MKLVTVAQMIELEIVTDLEQYLDFKGFKSDKPEVRFTKRDLKD